MKRLIPFFGAFLMVFTHAIGQTVILNEDFESAALPTNWSRSQNTPSAGWEFGDSLGSDNVIIPDHTNYTASNDDRHDDFTTTKNKADQDYLITPSLDFSPFSSSGVILIFDYLHPGNFGSTATIEVTTNGGNTWVVLDTLDKKPAWTRQFMDLSSFTGSSTVQVGFRHNDGGNWADGFALDNVLVRSALAVDISLDEITVEKYVAAGNNDITGTIRNIGYQNVNSLNINYSINGGTTFTHNLTSLNLGLGDTYDFTHATQANIPSSGTYLLQVWVDSVNGTVDGNPADNTLSKNLIGLSKIPDKKVIIQQHTGAWNGLCPDATWRMKEIVNDFPSAIPVSVHAADDMQIQEGTFIGIDYISGYPSGIIDYVKFDGEAQVELERGKWYDKVEERLDRTVPVEVRVTNFSYDYGTRELNFDVEAEFYGPVSGDLRLNGWITEDEVTGTGPGYDQANNYNGTSGHPYQGKGDPIVGFHHDWVLRAMMDGPYGQSGNIPSSVDDGDIYKVSYSYTLDSGINQWQISVIGVIQQYDSLDKGNRELFNADKVILAQVSNENDNRSIPGVKAWPNPFSEELLIDFEVIKAGFGKITVFDIYGREVQNLFEGNLRPGKHHFLWDGKNRMGEKQNSGLYLVEISQNGSKSTLKVLLSPK